MSSSVERFGEDFGAERMWGLKELAYPDAIPFVPQTAGWLIVLVLFLVLLAFGLWRLWVRRQRNAYRRDGVFALEQISCQPERIHELPFVLRKAALLSHPRAEVAALRGVEWRTWLNTVADAELFAAEDQQLLDELAYRKKTDVTVSDAQCAKLSLAAIRWMKVHRAGI